MHIAIDYYWFRIHAWYTTLHGWSDLLNKLFFVTKVIEALNSDKHLLLPLDTKRREKKAFSVINLVNLNAKLLTLLLVYILITSVYFLLLKLFSFCFSWNCNLTKPTPCIVHSYASRFGFQCTFFFKTSPKRKKFFFQKKAKFNGALIFTFIL